MTYLASTTTQLAGFLSSICFYLNHTYRGAIQNFWKRNRDSPFIDFINDQKVLRSGFIRIEHSAFNDMPKK